MSSWNGGVQPWIGHSRKLRRRRVLRRSYNSNGYSRQCDKGSEDESAASSENKSTRTAAHTASQLSRTETSTVVRNNQPHNLFQRLEVVDKPLRFRGAAHSEVRLVKEGEVVRPSQQTHVSGHT